MSASQESCHPTKTESSSQAVAPQRQYAWWREAVSDTHLGWDLPSRRETVFAGRIAQQRLGPLQLLLCSCDPCNGSRQRPQLARSDEAYFGILYLLRGRERLVQAGRDIDLAPGFFTLWDSTRPIDFHVPDPLQKITLLVPQRVLEAALPQARHLTGQAIDGRQGVGALFTTHLRALLREGRDGLAIAEPIMRATFDLLAAALQPAEAGEGGGYGEAVRGRIRDYILQHLTDPALDPEMIANGMGLSLRQLHRIFAGGGATLERWIWQQRLERCRQDLLLEPKLPVSQIAFRWGFSDAAHFSRAFRGQFGTTPSQCRAKGGGPLIGRAQGNQVLASRRH
jgi:AraC-like DNA-binding protein